MKKIIDYYIDGIYTLAIDLISIPNEDNTFKKNELFVLTANKDKKVGPCFVSTVDGALLSLKFIKKINREGKNIVMIKAF